MNIDASNIEKLMRKLKHKDYALFISLQKKMNQIAELDSADIEHFKNLRHDLSHLKRVRIGSFVLTFQVKGNTIILEDLVHHDRAYKR